MQDVGPWKHCDQVFSRYASLQRHLRTAHSEDNCRLSCNQCHKTFSRKDLLQRHEKAHQGLGKQACGICSRSFRADYLDEHRTICARRTKQQHARIRADRPRSEVMPAADRPFKAVKLKWAGRVSNNVGTEPDNAPPAALATSDPDALRIVPSVYSYESVQKQDLLRQFEDAIGDNDRPRLMSLMNDWEEAGFQQKALRDCIKAIKTPTNDSQLLTPWRINFQRPQSQAELRLAELERKLQVLQEASAELSAELEEQSRHTISNAVTAREDRPTESSVSAISDVREGPEDISYRLKSQFSTAKSQTNEPKTAYRSAPAAHSGRSTPVQKPRPTTVSQRLQNAQAAASSAPQLPTIRGRNPFQGGSPLNPFRDGSLLRPPGAGTRQQRRQEAEKAGVEARKPTKTISPRDALLEFEETEPQPPFRNSAPEGYNQSEASHTGLGVIQEIDNTELTARGRLVWPSDLALDHYLPCSFERPWRQSTGNLITTRTRSFDPMLRIPTSIGIGGTE